MANSPATPGVRPAQSPIVTIQQAADRAGEFVSAKTAQAIAEALGLIAPSADGEEWRPVAEFAGHYEVSNLGRVRSVDRIEITKTGNRRGRVGRVLIPAVMKPPRLPYHRVGLCADGKQVTRSVSRLVAIAFLGDPPSPDMQAAHLDNDPTNNRADNLMWASPAENLSHQVIFGTRPRGEQKKLAKLTEDDVRAIRKLVRPGFRARKIANHLGLDTHLVHNVITGRTWSHVQ